MRKLTKRGMVLLTLLAMLIPFSTLPRGAAATNPILMDVKEDPPIEGNLSFARCVNLALRQSPYLTSSALDIDLKKLDVSDAKYSFIPGFSLRTLYYVNAPDPVTPGSSANPYTIQFITEQYNPIENYFNLRARQKLTKIAVYAHLLVISDYLQRLAMGFLELESLDRIAELQEEIIALARKDIAYIKTRGQASGTTVTEIEMAEQQLMLAVSEKEKLDSSRVTILDGLRYMLGLKPTDPPLDLDLRDARGQVLNQFDPNGTTLAQVRSNSLELKIQTIKKEMQEKNITLAYARFLPTIVWTVQTTDPLYGRDQNGLYFALGLELPIWDGLKRYHNIERQKIILKQYLAEGETKGMELGQKWNQAQLKLKTARDDLKVAEAREKVAALSEKQAGISYGAGGQALPNYYAEQRTHLEAKKMILAKKLEYNKAVLAIRGLSGELLNSFVVTASFGDGIN